MSKPKKMNALLYNRCKEKDTFSQRCLLWALVWSGLECRKRNNNTDSVEYKRVQKHIAYRADMEIVKFDMAPDDVIYT